MDNAQISENTNPTTWDNISLDLDKLPSDIKNQIEVNNKSKAISLSSAIGNAVTFYSTEESINNVFEINDFGISIGKYYSHITCTVTKNTSNSYSATVSYYLNDNYDWDRTDNVKVGLISPQDMWELNHSGNAKAYAVQGVNNLTINWTTGQRYDTGATIVDVS